MQKDSLAVETELFAIQATKMAHQIFEELTSSTSQGDDVFPSGGEEPYETIEDVRQVMILGTQLSRVCWGSNAMNNRAYYIADTGHVVTVKPRQQEGSISSDSVNSGAVRRVSRFLEEWMKETGWKLRQAEVSNRLDQHGEVFDLLHYGQDGILRPYFAEPTDLDDDPKSIYQDADPEDSGRTYVELLGVRRTNDIRYVPTDYFINDQWFPDLLRVTPMGRLPDSEKLQERTAVQHRKRNVLGNDPRGLTLYWPVREEMVFAKKLLANLMRVSAFQAAFGAIRTINASQGADAVRSWMNSQQTGAGNSGESEKFDFPSAAVVTVPQSVSYDFPETGAGNSNQIEVLVSLLRACAAGMKLPEFMLTANVSEGNFASTLVSEGPFHKGMRFEQFQMVTEDERILWQALKYAAASGEHDISESDVEAVVLHIKPPRVQTRNRQEDFEVNKVLYDAGELSGKTWLAEEGKERESEQAQRELELKEELPLPAGSMLAQNATLPGPDEKGKADPMKEKGVSKGNPEKIVKI